MLAKPRLLRYSAPHTDASRQERNAAQSIFKLASQDEMCQFRRSTIYRRDFGKCRCRAVRSTGWTGVEFDWSTGGTSRNSCFLEVSCLRSRSWTIHGPFRSDRARWFRFEVIFRAILHSFAFLQTRMPSRQHILRLHFPVGHHKSPITSSL